MGQQPHPEGEDEHPSGGNRQIWLAVSGGSSFDVLTGQYTGSFVNIPVTYQFSDAFKVNVNGGWIYERGNNQHLLTYGAGLEWIPVKPFTILAEVFGVAGAPGRRPAPGSRASRQDCA